jgi:hypothetical protein
VPAKDDDACRAVAERINKDRPQWLVLWGRYTHRFWGFPLFEMQPRMVVWAHYPDALVPRLDEAERRFRVWPDRREVSDCDTGSRRDRRGHAGPGKEQAYPDGAGPAERQRPADPGTGH